MTENRIPDRKPIPRLLRWRLGLLRTLAAAFITIEKSLEVFWPLILWLCAFATLWLLQLPDFFGRFVEILTAIIFFVGLAVLTIRGLLRFRVPRHRDITRRIESDSKLPHRPLSGLEDHLANPVQDETQLLWAVWQSRLNAALRALRLPRPHPLLARIDPYAFRALAIIMLVVAVIMAGSSWPDRLRSGMMPVSLSLSDKASDKLVIWITPPVYTGQQQIVLKGHGRKSQPVSVPEGSIVKIRVTGGLGTPELLFDDALLPLTKMGGKDFGIETPVQPASTLKIRQSLLTRASWTIAFGKDLPPKISRNGDIKVTPKGTFQIPLKIWDDYSVENVTLRIRLDPSVETGPPMGSPVEDVRTVMSPGQTEMDFSPQFDLAWHPWAGMAVIVSIEAKDHKGQIAKLEDIPMTLPEREFRHPTAKNLVEMRKRLIWTPEAAAHNVAYDMESVLSRPGLYYGDMIVFLALRTGASRLLYDDTRPSVANVISLLWDTTLRIEDGNFSIAARDFKTAQKALQDALKDPNSTPEQIATLMEQMRQAMGQYMQEMFREMQKRMSENGKEQPLITPEMVMQSIRPQDLAAFLDKMQAEALTGDREAARQMLSEMEQFMEMLDPSAEMTLPKDMQAMMEAVSKLQELIEQQKSLLEDTKKQAEGNDREQAYGKPLQFNQDLLKQWGLEDMPPASQETPEGKTATSSDIDSAAQKEQQDSLRKKLGDLMLAMDEKLGQIPENMGKAEQSMRQSSEALSGNDPGGSVPHQETALQNLQEGQQQMNQQLAQRMQQMMMFAFGMGPTDPLGRPMEEGGNGTPWSGSKVKIPDQAERRHIQDILDQLRKKSGELQRPDYELDYYRRLMKQF